MILVALMSFDFACRTGASSPNMPSTSVARIPCASWHREPLPSTRLGNFKEDEALPRQLEQQDVRLAYAAGPALDKLAER